METIHDGNLSGCDVSNHFRNEERAEFRSDSIFCLSIAQDFFLKSMNTTDTYTIYYSDFVQIFFFEVHFRVCNRLFSGNNGILCIQVHLAHFFAVDKIGSVEPFYLTSKLCFEFRRIEMSNRPCSAYTIHKILPCFGNSVTNRSKRTKTCYYNSF